MNLHISEEQRLLKDAIGKLFATESSMERVRAAEKKGYDANLWNALCAAGVPIMRVPEEQGGLGYSLLDAILIAEEAGKQLASVPLAEAIAAAGLLAKLASSDAAAEFLDRVMSGSLITLSLADTTERPVQAVSSVAEAILVLEGDCVSLLIPPATEMFERNLGDSALVRRALSGPDSTGLKIELAKGEAARNAYLASIEEWYLLAAAMQTGLASRGLEMAAAYSKERHAFGRPIGSFQGIAHPLADAITEVEGAQLLNWRAAYTLSRGSDDAAASIPMAYWWATQTAANAMAKALHTFGGYGVSLEYDIQLYYRRAKAWSLLAGDPNNRLLAVAERLWSSNNKAYPLPDAGEITLDFSLGSKAEAFAAEVDAYFEKHLTEELKAHAHHSVDGFHPEFNKQLARDKLLFPHWPSEFGGQERDAYDVAAMTAVFEARGWEHVTAPITNQVAQIVMLFGHEEVKQEALTKFGRGESLACMGFTEPSCGCDVFAAKTKAERQADGSWLINGQKIFTTAANVADYCFLLARTNPAKPKHAGLSVFLVPMNLPGIEVHAVHTLQDERTNIVYFSDVVLDEKYLVGPVDGGLEVMASTLEMEHGSADQYRHGHVSIVTAAEKWAKQASLNGRPLLNDPFAASRLAKARVHLEVSTLLCRRAIWAMVEHIPNRYWGPMAKLFATEIYQRDASDLMNLAAPDSLFQSDEGLGLIELGYRQSIGTTIYGGTSEVQRSLVAEQALGMPKSRS